MYYNNDCENSSREAQDTIDYDEEEAAINECISFFFSFIANKAMSSSKQQDQTKKF